MAIIRECMQKLIGNVCMHARFVGSFKRPDKIFMKTENSVFLNEVFASNKDLTNDTWHQLRQDAISSSRIISDVNVDSLILGNCVSTGNLDLGKSYIKFLESNNNKINYATWGKFLKLYYTAGSKSSLQAKDVENINKIYKDLLKTTPILDAHTSENLILALSLTENWRECEKLFEMIKLSCTPSVISFCVLISSAFRNGASDIGWQYLNELVDTHKTELINDEVYLSWINYCAKTDNKSLEGINKMLKFIQMNDIIVTKKVAEDFSKILGENNYAVAQSTVNKSYHCSTCRGKLETVSLTPEEFNDLRDTFLQSVLIRKDIFVKTNPKELENFAYFLDKTAPYDCVIDGLNIAFSRGNNKSPKVYARQITSVAKHFINRNKKVLILGRQHMNKWPAESMNYIRNKCSIFLTENLSHDDPYLLYAALNSGPNTKFVSKDLMRSHSFLLEKNIKKIFAKWQRINQYLFIHTTEKGRVIFEEPNYLEMTVQQHGNSWHLPYSEVDEIDLTVKKTSWLCIKKRDTSPKLQGI